jgi:hypothetical protein
MNDVGYYDGYVDFTLTINNTLSDFKLTFYRESQYKAKKYLLREYLEDVFAETFYN